MVQPIWLKSNLCFLYFIIFIINVLLSQMFFLLMLHKWILPTSVKNSISFNLANYLDGDFDYSY